MASKTDMPYDLCCQRAMHLKREFMTPWQVMHFRPGSLLRKALKLRLLDQSINRFWQATVAHVEATGRKRAGSVGFSFLGQGRAADA